MATGMDTIESSSCPNEPTLSIIIVNWNTRDLLAQCLESIYESQSSNTFEIIVVDNGSTDKSPDLVHTRYTNVSLIENRSNIGFARANNQAISFSRAKYVLLLNSDTIIQAETLTTLVAFLDDYPDVAVVGGQLLNRDGSFQASFGDFPTLLSEVAVAAGLSRIIYGRYYPSHNPSQSAIARSVDWVGGACLAARKSAIESVGGLDESFFMYFEELDWCYRFHLAGWRVCYLPEAKVIHLGGQSTSGSEEKKLIWLNHGRLRFFEKYKSHLTASTLRACLRVIAICKGMAWLGVALISDRRRDLAIRKIKANWLIATEAEW